MITIKIMTDVKTDILDSQFLMQKEPTGAFYNIIMLSGSVSKMWFKTNLIFVQFIIPENGKALSGIKNKNNNKLSV